MPIDLLDRIPEWEREAERFEAKARALRQMVESVQVLNGDANRILGLGEISRTNQYSTAEGPRGRDAVRRITSERPGIWRVADIKKVNRERGWPSNDTALETAVVRLAANGEAVKIKKGTYSFGADAPDGAITDEEGGVNEGALGAGLDL
jgi:hypothetical protein